MKYTTKNFWSIFMFWGYFFHIFVYMIFLPMHLLSQMNVTLGFICMAQVREKYKMNNSCPQSDSSPQSLWFLISLATDWASQELLWPLYIHVLTIYWHKFEAWSNEEERFCPFGFVLKSITSEGDCLRAIFCLSWFHLYANLVESNNTCTGQWVLNPQQITLESIKRLGRNDLMCVLTRFIPCQNYVMVLSVL